MKTRNTLAIAAAAAVLAAPLLAQDHKHGMKDTHGMMDDRHAKMSQMHQMMMADWKAQDADLEKLVSEMNTAEGDKKIAAIAAVASKLVELRLADHAKMTAMPGMMMDQSETEGAKKMPDKGDAGKPEQQ